MSEYEPGNSLITTAIAASTSVGAGLINTCSLAASNAALTPRLTSLTVSTQQVAAVVSGLVTITGLSAQAGTTLTFYMVETVSAGGWMDKVFDPPLPASGPNVPIVVTLAAIASGGASAITLTGWQA